MRVGFFPPLRDRGEAAFTTARVRTSRGIPPRRLPSSACRRCSASWNGSVCPFVIKERNQTQAHRKPQGGKHPRLRAELFGVRLFPLPSCPRTACASQGGRSAAGGLFLPRQPAHRQGGIRLCVGRRSARGVPQVHLLRLPLHVRGGLREGGPRRFHGLRAVFGRRRDCVHP